MCPLCGLAHGTLRHVMLSCALPILVVSRLTIFELAEACLKISAPMNEWILSSQHPPSRGGCQHPLFETGWLVDIDPRFPILSLISWLLPTKNEFLFELRTIQGLKL